MSFKNFCHFFFYLFALSICFFLRKKLREKEKQNELKKKKGKKGKLKKKK
jgi:hypothetical protein